jgi:chromosome segregation ATPase
MKFDDALSALSDNLTVESHDQFVRRINNGLQKIEKLRLENFNLKKQVAYDQKKYTDLKNAFVELRQSLKTQDLDILVGSSEVRELVAEKVSLQHTLKTLSDEVEFLSKKNEVLLKDLKTKDFYGAYRE